MGTAHNWEIYADYTAGYVQIDIGSRNYTGSALVSASKFDKYDAGYGGPIAGVYRYEVEQISPSVEVSVTNPNNHDTGNPLLFSGNRTVTADGATENKNLIPGVAVVLAAGLQVGDIFEIGIGNYWDSDVGEWFRNLAVGPVLPGFTTNNLSLQLKNVFGSGLSNCKLYVTNGIRVENDQSVSRPFYHTRQIDSLDPTADSDLDGRAIAFDNFSAGSPNTVDILVDGESIDVYDITGSATITDGLALKCDDTNKYKFADGTALQGLEFVLSSSLQETDTATIYTSDGGESVEIATENGSFVSGTTGIDLTDSDGVTGEVADDATVNVRLRISPNSLETSDLNMRLFSFRIISSS
jgi:hypothetical protein